MILRLEKIGPHADRFERPHPGHLCSCRQPGDADAIGSKQNVAAAADQSRESDALLRRYPAKGAQRTVGQRCCALLFQKLTASELCNQLRIEDRQMRRRRLIEYSSPSLDPLPLCF